MDAAEFARRYLDDVSNEPDAGRRRRAIEELFAEDVRYSDQDGVVEGREAFIRRIDELAAMMSPGSLFTLSRPAQAVDDAIVFHWRLGEPGAEPSLSGIDIAVRGPQGIHRLYAVLDPAEG